MKLGQYLTIGAIVLSLTIGLFAGWQAHSAFRPCPTITSDTIVVVDTALHKIADSLDFKIKDLNLTIKDLQKQVNYWKMHRDTIKLPGDTILVPADVDSSAIVKDYFAIYKYGWSEENDSVAIMDSVTITRNVPIDYQLYYKLKKPFTTIINNIDNSITYNSYLQVGTYLPIYNYADTNRFGNIVHAQLELTLVRPKWYLGVGWAPLDNTVGARFGATIFKIKGKK